MSFKFNPIEGTLDLVGSQDQLVPEYSQDPAVSQSGEIWVKRKSVSPTNGVLSHTLLQIGLGAPGSSPVYSQSLTHTLLHLGLTTSGPLVSYNYELRFKTLNGTVVTL